MILKAQRHDSVTHDEAAAACCTALGGRGLVLMVCFTVRGPARGLLWSPAHAGRNSLVPTSKGLLTDSTQTD